MRRRLLAAAVAVLLAVAGCTQFADVDRTATAGTANASGTPVLSSGGASAGTSAPTVTAGDSLDDIEYPPGFSPTDIDTAVLGDRTVALLRTEPVAVNALERFRPGAYADYEYTANASRARFRLDVHNGYSDVTERDVYVDSTARHSRRVRDGRLSFDTGNGSVAAIRRHAATSVWAVLYRIVTFAEFRAVRADRVDGELRIRYAVTGIILQNTTDARGYLIVDGDGVVREARVLYRRDGEPKRFEYVLLGRSSVSVRPPPWIPAARANG